MITCDNYFNGLCITFYKNGNGLACMGSGKCEYEEVEPSVREKMAGICKKIILIERNLIARGATRISLQDI